MKELRTKTFGIFVRGLLLVGGEAWKDWHSQVLSPKLHILSMTI